MRRTVAISNFLTEHHAHRFWASVDVSDSKNCWMWKGGKHPIGYGVFMVPDASGKWVARRANRVAYVLTHGDPEHGLVICHSCDNPSCCNPLHLFAATQAENLADMQMKGRKAIGSKNGLSKLTESDIPVVRDMLNNGTMVKDIAAKFGVSRTAISDIKSNRKWRHVMNTEKKATR